MVLSADWKADQRAPAAAAMPITPMQTPTDSRSMLRAESVPNFPRLQDPLDLRPFGRRNLHTGDGRVVAGGDPGPRGAQPSGHETVS
ncbi:hypothetical protein AMK29_19785 [Streptomyces sp. CB02261]|nr:hypothetical protein AMK29_19785 [Streptomyces sp. CB02261]